LHGTVRIEDIEKKEMGILFDWNAEESKKDGTETNSIDDSLGEEPSIEEDTKASDANDTIEKDNAICALMLDEKLIELYADVDPSTTDLLLCMKPISSKIENIFSVSFTRKAVEEDADLAAKGRKIRYAAHVDRNPVEASRILKDLDEKGKSIFLMTIICDVSIQCLETFSVKDKSTGTIVSGSTEPEEVSHLVRFEITTNLDETRRLGSWRIVDWDDLLEGNVWY
jgi:hypothetical protein